MDQIRVRQGLLTQDVRRAISCAAVMIGIPSYDSRARSSLSPETTTSARAATAHANTASSSGSASTTGPIGAGTTSRASAAYPTTNVCGGTFARARRWANFGRWSTSASSARRDARVKSAIVPVRAASSTWRGGPCHKSPETTVLVSATTCTGTATVNRGEWRMV